MQLNAQLLVRSMKGDYAKILFAFLFAGHAMTVEELSEWTGKPRQEHYHWLNLLCADGLLAKQQNGQRNIYLLGSEMLPALRGWTNQLEAGASLLEAGAPELQESGIPTPSAQESGIPTPSPLVVVVAESKFKVPTITTTTTTTRTQESGIPTPSQNALEAVLRKHSIIGTKKRALLACDWVDADYVTEAIEYAIHENTWDNPVGMAITRMLEHWEPPDDAGRAGAKRNMVSTSGPRWKQVVTTIPADLVQEVAAFTGHRAECPCIDCTIGRQRGLGYLCPTCKRYDCECADEDEQENN